MGPVKDLSKVDDYKEFEFFQLLKHLQEVCLCTHQCKFCKKEFHSKEKLVEHLSLKCPKEII